MIDLTHYEPRSILTAGLVAGIFLGGFIAAVFLCICSSRAYMRGRTDMEKLIRDRTLAMDPRNDTPLSEPITRK